MEAADLQPESPTADSIGVTKLVQPNKKLTPVEVDELVELYAAGTSVRDLTRLFGIHEQTVKAHLRRRGVTLRPLRALTPEQHRHASELRDTGWSYQRIGDRFGITDVTDRRAVLNFQASRVGSAE
ncbi:DNA invertase Pin-like site-specific DNA recombinase [Arthrobacter pigmenti]|uniref:DNA invertase Pin-like site-specific DNA recombinase n=1 Tax=Arthrobacter pigmenti TaxID=271432 RepID=A0A846RLH1_9MICC|nr:hypothetical protein [Arthrobacter pigmenti]NJC24238.1 DNA invertase Pin-like site-specific DNA recombinase [Arthrobacter pigmenti]